MLKAVLTSEEFEELEVGVKELYEQKDEKYILQVDGIDDHPSISALRNGHKRSKEERDDAKKKLQKYEKKFAPLIAVDEDIDLSEADEEMIENIAKWAKGEITLTIDDGEEDDDGKKKKKDDGPDIEKIKDMARRPLQRTIDELTAERDQFKGQLENTIINQTLTEALADAKVMGVYMGPLKSHFSRMVKLGEDEEGNPQAMIEGEYGEQTVPNFIKDWAQTDEGKAFIAADENRGGGSNGAGGRSNSGPKIKNPWSPEHRNVTEQMKLYREDPDKARRMAAEHGITLQ